MVWLWGPPWWGAGESGVQDREAQHVREEGPNASDPCWHSVPISLPSPIDPHVPTPRPLAPAYLQTGEHGLVNLVLELAAVEDHAAAGAAQRLVRGGGHDVRVREGAGGHTGGDQAAEREEREEGEEREERKKGGRVQTGRIAVYSETPLGVCASTLRYLAPSDPSQPSLLPAAQLLHGCFTAAPPPSPPSPPPSLLAHPRPTPLPTFPSPPRPYSTSNLSNPTPPSPPHLPPTPCRSPPDVRHVRHEVGLAAVRHSPHARVVVVAAVGRGA